MLPRGKIVLFVPLTKNSNGTVSVYSRSHSTDITLNTYRKFQYPHKLYWSVPVLTLYGEIGENRWTRGDFYARLIAAWWRKVKTWAIMRRSLMSESRDVRPSWIWLSTNHAAPTTTSLWQNGKQSLLVVSRDDPILKQSSPFMWNRNQMTMKWAPSQAPA